MRINTNVSSLVAQEAASNTNRSLSTALEKLSTGLRINKASDDSSGMAIADKLRMQSNSIGQGIANANSATAMIQIADKAMSEQSNILDTVKTKLIQASTSTTSAEGREAIRKDVTKLLQQLDNISGQTNYNGINLLKNKGTEFNFQIGEDKSFDVTLKTAYSVTSEGLGATKQIPVDADASLSFGNASGAVSISTDNTELTVKNIDTAAGVDKAITIGGSITSTASATDASFKISAKDVQSISLGGNTAGTASVTITTEDAATISVLNAMATDSTTLSRSSDGSYTLTATAAGSPVTLDFGGGKLDLNNLTFSGLSLGDTASTNELITIETDSEVSITKLSGGKNLSIDSSTVLAGVATLTGTLAGKGSTTPSGIAYSTASSAALVIDSGTASVKIDQTNSAITDASVAINSGVYGSANTDTSFQVSSNNVEKITLKMTAGTASVVLSTQDSETATKLKELSQYSSVLTDLGNGNFQLTATAANSDAVLDFGSDKVNLANLSFAGVQKGTDAGSTESIFVQTDSEVTVTKNGGSDQPDISIQGSSGTTVGAAFTSVDTNASSISGSLAGLKNLKEGELTSDIANNYLSSIDSALTQLNSVRSDFGSTQNQLESAIRNMTTTKTNIQAAESLIRDVDYAQESANFNKQNIIAQAGSYAMSQANAVQQNVLKLLQ